MQEWAAWDDAAGLAEDNKRKATDWVASWGTATLTVAAIVLPVICVLVAVAISH
jgi:heme/copper-type cytochrome/quinol oxidase subunit 2